MVFDEGKYEAKPPKFILTEKDFEPGWSWNTKLDQTYTGVKYQYTNSEKNRTFRGPHPGPSHDGPARADRLRLCGD